jgi:diguanylate cyclase (GGDEF)-like protein
MTVGEPPLGGWRGFRWVGQHLAAAQQRAVELDETTERRRTESRARRRARMTVRDRLVTGSLAVLFLLTATVIAVVVDSARAPSAITVALLVLAYAYASRVDVELGAGSAVPTGLVLIPMLFLVPLGQVPLWVATGSVLGALPNYLSGRERPERASILLAGCWRAVGPTLVLAVAGEGPPRLASMRLYLTALLAQLAFDATSAIIRDRLVHRIGYREILGYLSNAYLIDLCLAPVGLAFAIAVVARPPGVLLLFPLLFLMQSFARERMARIDQALELGAAYAGTGRLAEMYHELLAAESLDATLERFSNALSDLIAADGMQIVERKGIDERTLLARGRLDGERRVERSARTEGDAEPATSLTLTVFPATDVSLDENELQLVGWFADAAAVALAGARLKERLIHQARTDSLTGLINHGTFQEQLRSNLELGRAQAQPVTLLMLDIDDFKRINDVNGHGVGDDVLTMVAQTLVAVAGPDTHVCRVGGEEFTVIMPRSGSAEALELAERIRTAVAGRRIGSLGRVTVSIGVAEAPKHARSARELVARADDAMMIAKARGKDRALVYDATRRDDEVGVQRERRRRSLAHLRMLQSLTGKLNRLNDVHEIGEAIVSELRTLIDYHSCRVYIATGNLLAPIARYGELAYAEESFEALVVEVGEGIAGTAAAEARSLLIPDTERCTFAVQVPGSDDVAESAVAVPLIYEQEVTGVVVVSKLGLDQFDHDDVRLLEVLAGHASVAIENARLYQEMSQEAAGLELAFVSTVEALANALEATDALTSSHARAVKDLALSIGHELDLNPARMKLLELAALLHDIGKIGIPSQILTKASALTVDERRLVEQHPQIGERILQPIERLAAVRPIVRHCHERWDGAGYPDRLAGNDIPLEARIIFVADSYHAMTNDRPYAAAVTPEVARAHLRAESGTQFDPTIVAAFLGLAREGVGEDDLAALATRY